MRARTLGQRGWIVGCLAVVACAACGSDDAPDGGTASGGGGGSAGSGGLAGGGAAGTGAQPGTGGSAGSGGIAGTGGTGAQPGTGGAGGTVANPCDGVTCSGHGTCIEVANQAECECESGYEPTGLNCVPQSGSYLFRESFESGQDPFGFDWVQNSAHQTGQRELDPGRGEYVYHVNFHPAVTLYIQSAPFGTFETGQTVTGSVSGVSATVLQVEDQNHPGSTAEWVKVSGSDSSAWDPNDVLTGPNGSAQITSTAYFDSNDTYFGHRLMPDFLSQIGNRIHFRAYVRYGNTQNAYTWETGFGDPASPNQRSHELKWPDIGGGDGLALGRIIGKHRASGTSQGVFRVYTPDGSNHDTVPLGSGQWHSIEFMLEDNGGTQTVKIWLDNSNEGQPDYETTGAGLFDAAQWQNAHNWGLGYRNHAIPESAYPTGLDFYYDDVIIDTSFIGP